MRSRPRLALVACASVLQLSRPAFGWAPPRQDTGRPQTVPQAQSPQTRVRLAQLFVRGDALDPVALRQHLELRLAGVQVLASDEFPAPRPGAKSEPTPDTPTGAPSLIAVVSFRRDAQGLNFALEFSDGRAYDRSIPQAGPAPERVAASELASLINAVLEGQVPPDREADAALFEPDPLANPDANGTPDPTDGSDGSDASDASDASGTPRGPEFGLSFSGTASIGVAPADNIERGVYGGGGLAVAVSWPRGGTVSLGLSGHARARPLGVARLRVGLGGGYRWRPRPNFEWVNLAQVELDAWRIGSDETLFARGRAVERRPPLLGAALISTPRWRTELSPRASLSLGPRLGLGVRSSLGDPNGAPRITSAESEEVLARLGGLELELGLSVALWFRARSD